MSAFDDIGDLHDGVWREAGGCWRTFVRIMAVATLAVALFFLVLWLMYG